MLLMKEDDRKDAAPSSLDVKFKETKGLKLASFAHTFVEEAAEATELSVLGYQLKT